MKVSFCCTAVLYFVFVQSCFHWSYACIHRFVIANGTNTGDCCDPNSPCETIAYALSKSQNFDTVHIRGNFSVNHTTSITHTVTLTCEDDVPCEINGGMVAKNCLYITSTGSTVENIHCRDFVATGIIYDFESFSPGHSLFGLIVENAKTCVGIVGAQVQIAESTLVNCRQTAVLASRADVHIVASRFVNNTVQYQPSLCGVGLTAVISNVTIDDAEFVDSPALPTDEMMQLCSIINVLGNSDQVLHPTGSRPVYPTKFIANKLSLTNNRLQPLILGQTPAQLAGLVITGNRVEVDDANTQVALLTLTLNVVAQVQGGNIDNNLLTLSSDQTPVGAMVSVQDGTSVSFLGQFGQQGFIDNTWADSINCKPVTSESASDENQVFLDMTLVNPANVVQCQPTCLLQIDNKVACNGL